MGIHIARNRRFMQQLNLKKMLTHIIHSIKNAELNRARSAPAYDPFRFHVKVCKKVGDTRDHYYNK